MLSLHDALFGLALPALVGAVAYLLSGRLQTGHAAGLALSLGFVVGFCSIHGWPKVPPAEALDWLATAALAMAVALVLDQFLWRRKRIAIFQLTIVASVYLLIVLPIAKNGWPFFETLLWIAGSFTAGGSLVFGLSFACRHNLPIAVTIALSTLSLCAAGVEGLSGSQTYGLQAATMPAVLMVLAIVSFCRHETLFRFASMPALVMLYTGMLLCAYLYTNLTIVNGLLLAVAPLGLLVGCIPAIRAQSKWKRALVPIVVAIIPGAIALGLALHQFLIDVAESWS